MASNHSPYFLKPFKRNDGNHLISNENFRRVFRVNGKYTIKLRQSKGTKRSVVKQNTGFAKDNLHFILLTSDYSGVLPAVFSFTSVYARDEDLQSISFASFSILQQVFGDGKCCRLTGQLMTLVSSPLLHCFVLVSCKSADAKIHNQNLMGSAP